MSKVKLFISFRFRDGKVLKDKIEKKLVDYDLIISKSESENRVGQTEETIKKYLYKLLADSSITIGIITPEGKTYEKENGKYNDWLYDEIRYSLEDRTNNRTNALIAIYNDEVKYDIFKTTVHSCEKCRIEQNSTIIMEFDNLLRKNMFNVKDNYKKNKCNGVYDNIEDHYVTLVHIDDFLEEPEKYIDYAIKKKNRINEFDLVKRM